LIMSKFLRFLKFRREIKNLRKTAKNPRKNQKKDE